MIILKYASARSIGWCCILVIGKCFISSSSFMCMCDYVCVCVRACVHACGDVTSLRSVLVGLFS